MTLMTPPPMDPAEQEELDFALDQLEEAQESGISSAAGDPAPDSAEASDPRPTRVLQIDPVRYARSGQQR